MMLLSVKNRINPVFSGSTWSVILLFGSVFVAMSCARPTERGLTEISAPAASAEGNSTHSLHHFAQSVTPDFLRAHLFELAGDAYEGRGNGLPGLDRAASYIAAFYDSLGVTPLGDNGSYFQHFNLTGRTRRSVDFTAWSVTGSDTTQVYAGTFSSQEVADFAVESGIDTVVRGGVVFVGFGVIDAQRGVNHFGEADLSGRWVMMFGNVPYVMDGDTLINPAFNDRERITEALFRRGGAGLLVIRHPDDLEFAQYAHELQPLMDSPAELALVDGAGRPRVELPVATVSPERAMQLLGRTIPIESNALYRELAEDPAGFSPVVTASVLEARPVVAREMIPARNIVAVFEGNDPDLRDEYVVISAHYDHMGIGAAANGDRIYNGADDNGSGTVGLLALARALHDAREAGFAPRRSVILLHVTAEEVGLLGSRYYSDNPTVPIGQIVANLNIDMIGRTDAFHDERGEEDYVYIIGAEIISSDMKARLETAKAVQENPITLSMRYNDLNDRNQFYRRSDHWNFGRLQIPFIFFFTGVHADYHQPGDTPDKIRYDKYARIVQLVYGTTVELANTTERPVVDNQEFINRTRSGR